MLGRAPPARGGWGRLMGVVVVVHVGGEGEKKHDGVGSVLLAGFRRARGSRASGCDGGTGMTGFGEGAWTRGGRNGWVDIGRKLE